MKEQAFEFVNHEDEYTQGERRRIAGEGYLDLDLKTRIMWCRIGYSIRGYMYFIDAGPTEALDVCRSLWLTGAISYISLRVDYLSRYPAWKWSDHDISARQESRGGYSE